MRYLNGSGSCEVVAAPERSAELMLKLIRDDEHLLAACGSRIDLEIALECRPDECHDFLVREIDDWW